MATARFTTLPRSTRSIPKDAAAVPRARFDWSVDWGITVTETPPRSTDMPAKQTTTWKRTRQSLTIVLTFAGWAVACGEPPGGSSGTGGTPDGGGGLLSGAGGTSSGGGSDAGSGGSSGGAQTTGGSDPMGGAASGGGSSISCTFEVTSSEISPGMATVGIVEWSLTGATPDSAKVVFELDDADSALLNLGGEAPVDLSQPNFRTLLLGLKQERDYTFHIEAVVDGQSCSSEAFALPTTGMLPEVPETTVEVMAADKREPGFILGTTGVAFGQSGSDGPALAYIVDADGDIVWAAPAPSSPTRATLDYEGKYMWMLNNNVQNGSGEMRYLSLDGLDGQEDVEGLSKAHHDFTVMPGGKVAAMVWVGSGSDPESDLVIRSPDGTIETPFRIGANLYASSSYHCNAIHYLPEDDSFTISDRNPDLYVKVSASGELKWQLGGNCSNAPAGPDKCSAQSWEVNHGHQLLGDGKFVLFNNTDDETSHVLEFQITETDSSMTASLIKDYTGTAASPVLGDVQRLPGGNTLIIYSTAAQMVEVDSSWNVVQTFGGSVGYASWRPTLYGPPLRL